MIIGINGKPGSGKDTMAEILCQKHNFKRYALADCIRELVSNVTGLSVPFLRSHPEKDMPLLNFGSRTPRELTIQVGNAFEKIFGRDIWNHLLDRKMQQDLKFDNFVIPDIRFPEQAEWIKRSGGLLVHIKTELKKHKYSIENELNNYKKWDFVVCKACWFQDPELVIEKILHKI